MKILSPSVYRLLAAMEIKISLIITLIFTFSINSYAQKDWETELSEDLVEISGDKMIIEDYALTRINAEGFDPISMQIKLYSEAPKDGIISRDNFVSFTGTYTYIILISAFADQFKMPVSDFLNVFELEDLNSVIGKADLELSFYFTDEGMQTEILNTATNQSKRITQTWKEVFEK